MRGKWEVINKLVFRRVQTIDYLGTRDLAEWFGVQPNTVTAWTHRYSDTFPKPDAYIRNTPGWLPERKDEVMTWWIARGLATRHIPVDKAAE